MPLISIHYKKDRFPENKESKSSLPEKFASEGEVYSIPCYWNPDIELRHQENTIYILF